MCEHVVSSGASTNGWRAGGGVQPFLGMWPSMCQSWVAIQMYSLESHGTENRGSFLQQYTTPFWLMLVWLNTTPCYPLPGDGSRSGDINTTMTCCCCSSSFLYLHVLRGHQHHNDDDVVVVVISFFCICT